MAVTVKSASLGCLENKFKYVVCLMALLSWSGLSSAQVRFENTTAELGGPFHVGESWGASWGSINDDVYPDLYVSNHGMLNNLLRNNGANSFTDVIQSADLEGITTISPDQDIHGGSFADLSLIHI